MKTKKNFRPLGAAVMALSIATASAISIAQLAPEGKTFSKAQATAFAGPLQTERRFDRLIIKFKDKATTHAGVFDFHAARNQVAMLDSSASLNLAKTSAVSLSYLKSVTAQTHAVITGQKLSRAELFALAKQIEQDASVAYAEIDEIVQPQFTPNDPDYLGQQWHYQTPATYPRRCQPAHCLGPLHRLWCGGGRDRHRFPSSCGSGCKPVTWLRLYQRRSPRCLYDGQRR